MYISIYKSHPYKYFVFLVTIFASIFVLPNISASCNDTSCSGNGVCKDELCVCDVGWGGSQCQHCVGNVSSECKSSDASTSECEFYHTCSKCKDDPLCGWCDDGSGTGIGICLPGEYEGPITNTTSTTCPVKHWYFGSCPQCQCNGHGSCDNNSSTCIKCNNRTTGSNCQQCIKGYWGSTLNGGQCKKCQCSLDANDCNTESGACNCLTKGTIGNNCDQCDKFNHYYPDPYKNNACYYELFTDYRFTFNISKPSDKYFTRINYFNSPTKPNLDVDVQITCSKPAKVNVTVKTEGLEEKTILENLHCGNITTKLSKDLYKFDDTRNISTTKFYAHVYDFQTPTVIQISFSQYPKLNLQQFGITLLTAKIYGSLQGYLPKE
ncbi:attractin-like [Diabrotica undecimpunctata]|uniref:attractin-like n=1 Tax=Diabrotica undecimpunctata TaxID=50387 RepID=UPI003B63B638